MKKNFNKNNGFTLVEILLYVAIAGGIVFSVTMFFLTMLDARERNEVVSSVEQEGVQAMQIITQTIRNSTTINAPGPSLSGPTINLTVTDGNKSPTMFNLSGGAIGIKEGAADNINLTSPKIIASNLNFANLSHTGTRGIIRIRFTLSHINPGSRAIYDYSKTFYASASIR